MIDHNLIEEFCCMAVVNLFATPVTLVESEGTFLEFRFTLDAPPPPEGITVTVAGNVPQSLTQLDLFALEFTGGSGAPVGDTDFSGFSFTITSQTATVRAPILLMASPKHRRP
ncbi:MAG: hypothetical protein HC895_00160 [Leptolyngbyaceae cyanobacterium SM1_3_5]|nr:hypothetical protein [Leptolyngbyaceae cyanobacterium SM1_3_5]